MTSGAQPLRHQPAPAAAPGNGALIGYGRVSTRDQNLDRQQAALTAAGCSRCFFDKASGKNTDRPGLAAAFDYLRPGDVLVVVSLDRLGRSLEDLIGIVGQLKRDGVGFSSLHEKLDTTTTAGGHVRLRIPGLSSSAPSSWPTLTRASPPRAPEDSGSAGPRP